MPAKLVINQNHDSKLIQTRISFLQFLTVAFMVEKGKGKSIGNFAYLAIVDYCERILQSNKKLSDELYAYIKKIKNEEPHITFIPNGALLFELFPSAITQSV